MKNLFLVNVLLQMSKLYLSSRLSFGKNKQVRKSPSISGNNIIHNNDKEVFLCFKNLIHFHLSNLLCRANQ